MRSFVLYRREDASGVSGIGVVAEGAKFSDGSASLRWLTKYTSTAVYESMEVLEAIHGHGGKTVVIFEDDVTRRAAGDALQDSCENCHFASIGGPKAGVLSVDEKRKIMTAPDYISEDEAERYIAGYQWACVKMYGNDWRTCQFSWKPALTIP